MAAELIAYCRVSTKHQGLTGLGMEAQRTAVESYARQQGARVAALYVEVESGKRSDRPELAKALAHAKRGKATLCVAKLDRLARNVEFLARILNAGTDFVACDYPSANRLTLHIMAAVAENEAKAVSDRTKAALAAAKARGTLLGSSVPASKGRRTAPLCRPKCAARPPWKPTPTCGRSWRSCGPRGRACKRLPTSWTPTATRRGGAGRGTPCKLPAC